MAYLGLNEVIKLLEMQDVSGEPWQLERLRKWIERLVEKRGEAYVRENRRDLLSQWEQHSTGQFKTCL